MSTDTPKNSSPVFQHYTSAKPTMRMITKKGARITFIDHSFITADKECIRYLDLELTNPVLGITKGEAMTAEDADPMAALRAKIIAEHEAKKAEENKGPATAVDVEATDAAVEVEGADAPILNTLNTAKLAALAANSGS